MKAIFKGAMFAGVAAFGLSLAACDSKQENKAEDVAAAEDQATEAAADMTRAQAEGTATEAAADAAADKMEKAGEEKKDAKEDAADKMDKAPG